jgi:hypothetical protein
MAAMADMDQNKKKVDLVFQKRSISNVKVQVGLAVDVSIKMRGHYENGSVQRVVERILAMALRFDDNGEMDMFAFDDRAQKIQSVKESEFANYVDRSILLSPNVAKWGDSKLAPLLSLVRTTWFNILPPSPHPMMARKILHNLLKSDEANEGGFSGSRAAHSILLIASDGSGDDIDQADKIIRASFNDQVPLYFAFIGIGDPKESFFMERLAEFYPNVGYVSATDMALATDDQLYEAIITQELADWLKSAPVWNVDEHGKRDNFSKDRQSWNSGEG